MDTLAAVLTGKGTGAISSIQLTGAGAKDILNRLFNSAGGKAAEFKAGKILVGNIVDKGRVVDQVVIGCEETDSFAINCHGNPIIVEMIMALLARRTSGR